jgi:predicted tellurium resistance membrane protein TerC
VLVEGLIRRFRFLYETIAVVLALVGVKLLIEDFYTVGPLASLAVIAAAFTIGIVASVIADRRDPDIERTRAERAERAEGHEEEDPSSSNRRETSASTSRGS